jgi:predicted nucleotidyltransferase
MFFMVLAQPENLRIDLPLQSIADLCRRWKIDRLEIFGSSLRNDFRPDSDIDFLYTAAPDARWGWDIVDLQQELSDILHRPIHLLSRRAVESSENPFKRRSILSEARIIYATG